MTQAEGLLPQIRTDVMINIAPGYTRRRAYGVLVYEKRSDINQLVLTHKSRTNFNNPEDHGGDVAYLCIESGSVARAIAHDLADADDPEWSLNDIRRFIRTNGEAAYLNRNMRNQQNDEAGK